MRASSRKVNSPKFLNNLEDQEISTILYLPMSKVKNAMSRTYTFPFIFLGDENEKYQIINGGILATGPQQFELMEKHISEFYKVKKVVILYIGHDIRRSPFNFSKQELNCLENYQNCNGNEIFFGYPINSKNPNTFLKELREKRIQNYKSLPLDKRLKKRIKFFV